MSDLYRHEPALAAAVEHAERARRLSEPFRDAVRRAQEDFEQRQQIYRQAEQAAAVIESAAFQQFLQELQRRQALFREMAYQAALGVQTELESLETASEVLYRNRDLVNPLIWGTYSGGSSGPSRASPLERSHRKLLRSYKEVSKPEKSDEKDLPKPVKALTTAEVFTSTEVMEEISHPLSQELFPKEVEEREERRKIRREISTDTLVRLEPALAEVDSRFPRMWQGAIMALRGDNPDRVRHFSTSCRELLTQLLHQFAPDDEIRQWSEDPNYFDERKRPTRRARLLYIFRNYSGSLFADFTEANIKNVLEMFAHYNHGVHGIEAEFTDEQLEALETRSAHWLLSLARLGKLVN